MSRFLCVAQTGHSQGEHFECAGFDRSQDVCPGRVLLMISVIAAVAIIIETHIWKLHPFCPQHTRETGQTDHFETKNSRKQYRESIQLNTMGQNTAPKASDACTHRRTTTNTTSGQFRGNHLSNTTRLIHMFLKSGESCGKVRRSLIQRKKQVWPY